MSRTPLLRLLAAVFLAGTFFGLRTTLGAVSSMDVAGEAIASAAAPALLGPIASAGRKDWDCDAERVAVTSRWEDAALPNVEGQH